MAIPKHLRSYEIKTIDAIGVYDENEAREELEHLNQVQKELREEERQKREEGKN